MNKLAKVTGDYIKLLRLKNDFSKVHLAKKIGVSVYYLNKIENGELREFKDKIIHRIARAFRIKTAVLAIDIASMYAARFPGALDPKEKLALRAFGRIFKDLRRKKGLSIEQVARKANVSVANIRKVEQGVAQYYQPTWRAISLAIGYQLSDVMEIVYKELKISIR
jgi:transcriptional regulator with XRE-family HTH domain